MTLEEIRTVYDGLDKLLGIDTSGITLTFSPRMVRKYGLCCFHGKRPVEIRLASFLREDEAQLRQTALHEYAHAAAQLLTGASHGHDEVWKAVCVKIGCQPERLAAPCEAAKRRAAEYEASRAGRTVYVVTCRGCGAASRYCRRGKVVDAIVRSRDKSGCICRRCGGRQFDLKIEKECIGNDHP